MTNLSFIDKLNVLLKIMSSSEFYIIALVAIIILGVILLNTTKRKNKLVKILCLILSVILLAGIIYQYKDSLGSMLDYMMNNLFIVIYFPNLAIYVAAIVITNIIIWTSIFSKKVPNIIKYLNITIYCIITYILILILNIINKKGLNIFDQNSIYGNKDTQALIELTSVIFIVWILFLIIYKIIKPHIMKSKKNVKKIKNQKLANYKPVTVPYKVSAANNTINVVKNNDEEKEYNDILTVEDYKRVLSILKQDKPEIHEEETNLKENIKEETKYQELKALYSTKN